MTSLAAVPFRTKEEIRIARPSRALCEDKKTVPSPEKVPPPIKGRMGSMVCVFGSSGTLFSFKIKIVSHHLNLESCRLLLNASANTMV